MPAYRIHVQTLFWKEWFRFNCPMLSMAEALKVLESYRHSGHMGLLYLAAVLFVQLFTLTCYNIDTSQPVIYSGANGSYFGYSVALLNNSQGSW